MKKFLTIAAFMLFAITSAQAEMRIGATLKAGVFEVTEASEEFTGAHSSGASPGDIKKNASAEGDEAKGDFAYGSIFVEASANDKFAIGIDYVPMALESETTENLQDQMGSNVTNKVQVDFEDLTTVYALLYATENLYLKAGYTEVKVTTNENLATGGAYGNATLDGYTVGLGYNHNMDNDMFVRVETSYMEIGGTTLTNTNDSTKKVTADDITGYSASISLGKSF
mgnify:CR=1 FL=1|tara:strand:+ start:25 stop:702 length:678 start_codon:yes stop_codon:yes gene_type:complete